MCSAAPYARPRLVRLVAPTLDRISCATSYLTISSARGLDQPQVPVVPRVTARLAPHRATPRRSSRSSHRASPRRASSLLAPAEPPEPHTSSRLAISWHPQPAVRTCLAMLSGALCSTLRALRAPRLRGYPLTLRAPGSALHAPQRSACHETDHASASSNVPRLVTVPHRAVPRRTSRI